MLRSDFLVKHVMLLIFYMLSVTTPALRGAGSGDWIGRKAPHFRLSSLTEEKTYSLDSFKGKVVLVDFWASWCGPCKKALPQLAELQKKYKNEIKILAISIDEKKLSAQNFIKKYGIQLNTLYDADKKVATQYDVPAMPTLFVIDQNGIIRYVHGGYNTDHIEQIHKEIKQLLEV